MNQKASQATIEQSVNNIIDCLSNEKTSKSLKSDFEIISLNESNDIDKKICYFFAEKANDGFFNNRKSLIKMYFDLLLKSGRQPYYYTAFLLSTHEIYTESEGKKYYQICLDSKYLPSVLAESEHLAKTEKDISKVYEYCSRNTDSNDGSLEFNIGILTFFGIGTNEDQQLGKKYLEKSAAKGYNSAIVMLIAIYKIEDNKNYTKWISHLNNQKDIKLNFKSYFLTEASKRLWDKIAQIPTILPLFEDFEMMMFVSKNPKFLEYVNDSKLNEINERLFENDLSLTSIFIPSQVKKINKYAFKNCSNLISIEFGPNSNLEEIGEKSFANCINLPSLELPKSVKIIGTSSFENNKSLSKLELNEDIKTLSKNSFAKCISLKKLKIPSSLENLDEKSFYDCISLDSLEFSDGCKLNFIGDFAFHNTGLQTIDLPASITKTGMFSFHYCSKLKFVSFTNIITIGKGTFHSCDAITEVKIKGNELKTIGDGSFYGCAKLKDFNLQLPSNLETIESGAFQNCVSLESFNFENIKSIGELSFYGCNSLTTVIIPGTVKIINDESFEACDQLKNVIIEEGVEVIGERCFYQCINIEKINLPNTLIEVRSHAFSGCLNLADINLNKNTLKIGKNAFENCPKLVVQD